MVPMAMAHPVPSCRLMITLSLVDKRLSPVVEGGVWVNVWVCLFRGEDEPAGLAVRLAWQRPSFSLIIKHTIMFSHVNLLTTYQQVRNVLGSMALVHTLYNCKRVILYLSPGSESQSGEPSLILLWASSCAIRLYHSTKNCRCLGERWDTCSLNKSPTPLLSSSPCSTALHMAEKHHYL